MIYVMLRSRYRTFQGFIFLMVFVACVFAGDIFLIIFVACLVAREILVTGENDLLYVLPESCYMANKTKF